jgi:cellobiose phosphorylase
MYRLGIEGILGLRRQARCLQIRPRLPDEWQGFNATYCHRQTRYEIAIVRRGKGNQVQEVTLDGEVQANKAILLLEDGRIHQVHIVIGDKP